MPRKLKFQSDRGMTTSMQVYIRDSILLDRIQKIGESKADTLKRVLEDYCNPEDIRTCDNSLKEWLTVATPSKRV